MGEWVLMMSHSYMANDNEHTCEPWLPLFFYALPPAPVLAIRAIFS